MNKIKYGETLNTCYKFFLEGRGYIMIRKVEKVMIFL